MTQQQPETDNNLQQQQFPMPPQTVSQQSQPVVIPQPSTIPTASNIPVTLPPLQAPPLQPVPQQAQPVIQQQSVSNNNTSQPPPPLQPIKEEEQRVCNCESNCLTLNCPCFRRGHYCDHTCNCKKCKNNEEHAEERLEIIEQILSRDPMAFTAEETLNQEECASICNFAMLTSSVDAEPFKVVQRESPLSRLLTPDVINQAIRTVMSAANDDLKSATSENFEEHAENSVSKEFENVLITIVNHVKPANSDQG